MWETAWLSGIPESKLHRFCSKIKRQKFQSPIIFCLILMSGISPLTNWFQNHSSTLSFWGGSNLKGYARRWWSPKSLHKCDNVSVRHFAYDHLHVGSRHTDTIKEICPHIQNNHSCLKAKLFDLYLNPLTAKLFNLNFHPLEFVSRWRDPQLQVSENYSDLTKWRSTVFKSCLFMSHFIFNIFKMWYLMC